MPEAPHDAEASMRALGVRVQALQDRLQLARTPASAVSADGVPADQLARVAADADALERRIERVLERIDPGLGRDTRVLAELLRRHVPPPAADAAAVTGREAATN